MNWFVRLFAFLESPELIRVIFMFDVRLLSLKIPLGEYKRSIYERTATQNENNNVDWLGQDSDEAAKQLDVDRQALRDPRVNRRTVLLLFKAVDGMRVFTTCYFAYMIVKFYLTWLLERLSIKFPIHCYLVVGRLVVHESLEELIALLFAHLHLSWRLHQAMQPYYSLGVVDFALLSERELEMVYSRLDSKQTIALTISEEADLRPRVRSVLRTMCLRVLSPTRVIYKLRPNRTRESHKSLRYATALLTCLSASVFTAFCLILPYLIVPYLLPNEMYLRQLPNCDPEMDRVRASGKLPYLTLTWHRIYSGFMDLIANLVMYSEGGFVVYVGASCMLLLNLDLVEFWKSIDTEIGRLQAAIKRENIERIVAFERQAIVGRLHDIQAEVHELLAAICDFFEMVKCANEVISAFLKGMFACSLVVCALFTFYSRKLQLGSLPVEVAVVLVLMLSWVFSATCGFLVVHHHCSRSYTKLCALIAHDTAKHRLKYSQVLDYFHQKKSCFTLMEHVPLQATTFLTMIGWTFSCFCITTGLGREPRSSRTNWINTKMKVQ